MSGVSTHRQRPKENATGKQIGAWIQSTRSVHQLHSLSKARLPGGCVTAAVVARAATARSYSSLDRFWDRVVGMLALALSVASHSCTSSTV